MSRFTPCLSCRQEYDSPEDRRFHAQPNACHDCGPSVWLETAAGERLPNGDPLQQAVDCIGRGEILALKGIGGFHLVCDARNPMALARLRERKQRPRKPFAVMAANRASLAPLVQLDDGAEHWLAHPGAPVVILPKTRQALLPEAIAPGLDGLGVMLPQNPLHWLLFHQAAREPWRLALALLWQLGREDLIEQRVGQHNGWSSVLQMLHYGFNCPLSSSLGRVFDAVAALLGVCGLQTYEAQAAMLLEARVRRLPGTTSGLWHITPDNQLDLSPLLEHLLQVDNAQAGAEYFHANLSAALADWVICAAREHSIEDIVLSGGCLLNRWLRARLVADLKGHGVRVFLPQALPPGDGALALGQAWVAIMRANIKPEEDSTDVSGSTG